MRSFQIRQCVGAVFKNFEDFVKPRIPDDAIQLLAGDDGRNRDTVFFRANSKTKQFGQRGGIGIGNLAQVEQDAAHRRFDEQRTMQLFFTRDVQFPGQANHFEGRLRFHADFLETSAGLDANPIVKIATSSPTSRLPKIAL